MESFVEAHPERHLPPVATAVFKNSRRVTLGVTSRPAPLP